MSMKRLTDKRAVIEPGTYLVSDDLLDDVPEIQNVSKKELYYRLGLIENVLGKNYDLDKLRKMVELYRRYNARTIDRDTAKAEKREILKRYNTLSETLQGRSEALKEWQTNILSAGSLRSQMVMEPGRDKSFLLALKTISAMVGEDTTEKIICQKFGLDNQK